MPDFWEFPTVSMGLGPDRRHLPGALQPLPAQPWAQRHLAKSRVVLHRRRRDRRARDARRAHLGGHATARTTSIFVVNCNLQRLEAPCVATARSCKTSRAVFRGAGWNVSRSFGSEDWDPLFAEDIDGLLVRTHERRRRRPMAEVHGEPGAYVRQEFFGAIRGSPSSSSTSPMTRSYACVAAATRPQGVRGVRASDSAKGPSTVVLAKTVKGYGLGKGFEGGNAPTRRRSSPRSSSKLPRRLGIDVDDADGGVAAFYHPG